MTKNKLSDQWRTPQNLFDILDKGGVYQGIEFKGYHFSVDLAATKNNSKCKIHFDDYLKINLFDELLTLSALDANKKTGAAWLNPPYSNPKPFIEKAWQDARHCKIVLLVKCDPSTQWWATFWDYGTWVCADCADIENDKYLVKSITAKNEEELCVYCSTPIRYFYTKYYRIGPKPGCDYLFFPKRIKFDPPQELIDSGEVWDINCDTKFGLKLPEYKPKWVQKCKDCGGKGRSFKYNFTEMAYCDADELCLKCKGKGYKELSGPAFSCALIVFDRRQIQGL